MKIIYTHTDEAPALATASLLPIVRAFAAAADIDVELRDISLAGRILAQFPELLEPEQRVPDALAELGELAKTPAANIIKLPNISASLPQMRAAIAELQGKGYAIPDLPEDPADPVRVKYDAVKGSAVNPVLREGNSDRRATGLGQGVRAQASALDGRVVAGVEVARRDDVRRRLPLHREVRDGRARTAPCASSTSRRTAASRCSRSASRCWPARCSTPPSCAARRSMRSSPSRSPTRKRQGVLFSVHLKATMMKVSDPIIFGHAVRAVVGDVYDGLDANPNDGLASLLSAHPQVREAVDAALAGGPVDRDGRLRQGHHEPPRAVGRHRRRVDAGGDPLVGADVERRGRAAGHEVRHPRLLLRAAVRRDRRPLPRARCVRSGDDGDDAERRPHGAEGRGVRLARQDVRDRVGGHRAGRRQRRHDAARTRRRRRRHLADVPVQGRGDRRTGSGSRSRGHARPARPRSSGSTRRGRTTPSC